MSARWKSFGASVRGPGHVRAHLPNQDYFLIKSSLFGDVASVSDGVGSCATSHWGAKAACRAVSHIAPKWHGAGQERDALAVAIHSSWLNFVQPFSPEESAATCLFAIRPKRGAVTIGMLGDGLVAVLRTDGSYLELQDDKTDSFSNQTTALTNNTASSQWQIASIEQEECCAVLLCTDGVADDLLPERRGDFARHIFAQSLQYDSITACRELRRMLENWPVPKHTDDKTLVFLYRSEEKK